MCGCRCSFVLVRDAYFFLFLMFVDCCRWLLLVGCSNWCLLLLLFSVVVVLQLVGWSLSFVSFFCVVFSCWLLVLFKSVDVGWLYCVVGCWLLVIGCWLSVVVCWLVVVGFVF